MPRACRGRGVGASRSDVTPWHERLQHIRSGLDLSDPAAERGGTPVAWRECRRRALAMGPRRALRRGPLRPRSHHRDRRGRVRDQPVIGAAPHAAARCVGLRRWSIPLPKETSMLCIAFLGWLVLLYFCSSKPGWFGCLLALLLVGIILAGCGWARAPSAWRWRARCVFKSVNRLRRASSRVHSRRGHLLRVKIWAEFGFQSRPSSAGAARLQLPLFGPCLTPARPAQEGVVSSRRDRCFLEAIRWPRGSRPKSKKGRWARAPCGQGAKPARLRRGSIEGWLSAELSLGALLIVLEPIQLDEGFLTSAVRVLGHVADHISTADIPIRHHPQCNDDTYG